MRRLTDLRAAVACIREERYFPCFFFRSFCFFLALSRPLFFLQSFPRSSCLSCAFSCAILLRALFLRFLRRFLCLSLLFVLFFSFPFFSFLLGVLLVCLMCCLMCFLSRLAFLARPSFLSPPALGLSLLVLTCIREAPAVVLWGSASPSSVPLAQWLERWSYKP